MAQRLYLTTYRCVKLATKTKKGVTIDDFFIIKRCRYKHESSIYEALAIKKQNPILNENIVKPGKTFTLKMFNAI